jgi:hypothetical protein
MMGCGGNDVKKVGSLLFWFSVFLLLLLRRENKKDIPVTSLENEIVV